MAHFAMTVLSHDAVGLRCGLGSIEESCEELG